jgi:hypothetical protein
MAWVSLIGNIRGQTEIIWKKQLKSGKKWNEACAIAYLS